MGTDEKNMEYRNTDVTEVTLKEFFEKIGHWFNYIASKWIVICLFGLTGAALGFFYAFLSTPTYMATTSFVLEDDKAGGSFSSLAGLASVAGIDLGSGGGGIFQGDNLLELYKSRTMIEKTLLSKMTDRSELLIDQYISFNNLKDVWSRSPETRSLNFLDKNKSRVRDSVMSVIVKQIGKNMLSVSRPDKKTSIIKVVVQSKNEVFSKEFNEQIVKNVNDFYRQTKTRKSLENIAIIQRKTDSVRAEMYGAISGITNISDATPNLNPIRQSIRNSPMQKSQFDAESNKIVLQELSKNLEVTKLAALRENPLIEVIDEPVYPLAKKEIGKTLGTIVGGLLGGFLIVCVLSIKRLIAKIIQ